MIREQTQALMAEIGPIADLMAVGAFEGRDVWALVVDEETTVDVDLDPARGCLVLSAEVGQPPAAERAGRLELLLRWNYQWPDTGGARLAVVDQGGPVVLLADHPVAGLAAADLGQRLGVFVRLLRAWRDLLTGTSGSVADPSAGEARPEPPLPFGTIRV